MWLSAIKLAVSTGGKIYANKQRQKEAMSQAALLTAEKMARGETEYQGNHVPYIFIFDTREVGFVNIKYAFRMSSFIKQLKTSEHQYLRGSIIVTGGVWSRFLLKIIFWTQRPVAPVYLTDNNNEDFIKNLYSEIYYGIEKRYDNVSIVRP